MNKCIPIRRRLKEIKLESNGCDECDCFGPPGCNFHAERIQMLTLALTFAFLDNMCRKRWDSQ